MELQHLAEKEKERVSAAGNANGEFNYFVRLIYTFCIFNKRKHCNNKKENLCKLCKIEITNIITR